MRENLTYAIEDYLKAIYKLTKSQERASTNDLADFLDIKPASVTGMIQKLSETEPPLLDYQKHRGVLLTEEGQRVALEILRHHRLIELYLHQILGYPWERVHHEADQLEHVISEEFEERIADALGNPLHDPHGAPIPSVNLQVQATSSLRLSDLGPGDKAVIERVIDTDPDLLAHLSQRGLIPKTQLAVVDYSSFDNNLTIELEKQKERLVLGRKITRQIYVELID
ncbi:MAG: metal-dependent transcriptional regulator [Anaerolineae bacterium]|nr:metal-dependent transcriptional regulator [Anaerolineae bacterium]MDK1081812.1 metal-dependent transcriptional regulator [Anaerolineae bacterium]MDK1119372.1 metal-dependent transcriptional regulator [Anaerolineae bacterium]